MTAAMTFTFEFPAGIKLIGHFFDNCHFSSKNA